MCKLNKWGKTRIDPCMRNLVKFLNERGIETVMCCCGHGKYNPSLIVRNFEDITEEVFSNQAFIKRKRYYKKDKNGYYYIPEVSKCH